MAHDPRRTVTGFVDYVGLARLAPVGTNPDAATDSPLSGSDVSSSSNNSKQAQRRLAQLRVGILVLDDDLQLFTPFLKDMELAVDGVLFKSFLYVAEPAKDHAGQTGLTFVCMPIDLDDMEHTTFEERFEQRTVNVEFTDKRLLGTRFEGLRFNGKPTAEVMYGTHGGGTGRVSDMMGFGLLTRPHALLHVDPSSVERWHVTVTFDEWSRSPPWHVYDTLFINGIAATVVRVYSNHECDVVIPPKLRAVSTLMADAPKGALSVNIEISSMASALATGKTFRSQKNADEHFMRLAMNEGDHGRTTSGPSPWTGAVLVDNETRLVIGAASCNSMDGTHAEVACVEQARDSWPERFVLHGQGTPDVSDDEDDVASEEEVDVIDHDAPTDGEGHGMTLYVTHTPCAHRLNSDGVSVTACVPLLGAYKHVIRRVVVGITQRTKGDEEDPDLKHLAKALPDATIHVMSEDTELAHELLWTLREYTHWKRTHLPYTTGLVIRTLDGSPVSRSTPEFKDTLAPFLDALRTLAQAVLVNGDTLKLNPNAFEGLEPHEAMQIVARAPVYTSLKKAKKGHVKMRTRIVKQPFPLRVLLVAPDFAAVEPKDRLAWMPKTEALGSVTVYSTPAFFVADSVRNAPSELDITKQQDDLQKLVTLLWPMQPHMQMTKGLVEDGANAQRPDPRPVFHELGQRGIVTALVEGSDRFLDQLMNLGLVNELVVLTLPIISPEHPVINVAVPTPPELQTPYELALIASGQVNNTSITSAHYLVSPAKAAPPKAAPASNETKV